MGLKMSPLEPKRGRGAPRKKLGRAQARARQEKEEATDAYIAAWLKAGFSGQIESGRTYVYVDPSSGVIKRGRGRPRRDILAIIAAGATNTTNTNTTITTANLPEVEEEAEAQPPPVQGTFTRSRFEPATSNLPTPPPSANCSPAPDSQGKANDSLAVSQPPGPILPASPGSSPSSTSPLPPAVLAIKLFDTLKCAGRFQVRVDGLDQDIYLDIGYRAYECEPTPGELEARVTEAAFGADWLQGTMRLARSRADLSDFFAYGDALYGKDAGQEEGPDAEADAKADAHSTTTFRFRTGKRRHPQRWRRAIGSAPAYLEYPAHAHPRRLYLAQLFRTVAAPSSSSSSSSAVVLGTTEPTASVWPCAEGGWIDFDVDGRGEYPSFNGVINLPTMGAVEISGQRVGLMSTEWAEKWVDFAYL